MLVTFYLIGWIVFTIIVSGWLINERADDNIVAIILISALLGIVWPCLSVAGVFHLIVGKKA